MTEIKETIMENKRNTFDKKSQYQFICDGFNNKYNNMYIVKLNKYHCKTLQKSILSGAITPNSFYIEYKYNKPSETYFVIENGEAVVKADPIKSNVFKKYFRIATEDLQELADNKCQLSTILLSLL